MIKRFSSVTLIVLSLSVGAILADGPQCRGWVGLWRLAPVAQGQGVAVHIKISEQDGRCRVFQFDSDFTRVVEGQNVTITPQKLSYQSPPEATNFTVSLERTGDSAQGETRLLHPQFRATFARTAHRVTKDGDWDPVESVKAQADELGLANLAETLVDHAPTSSLEELEKYWNSQIEPHYYSAVQEIIYGESGGIKERRKNLARLLTLLKDDSFVKHVRLLTAKHEEVVRKIRETAPDLFYPNVFLMLPAFGAFDVSVETMGKTVLVRVAVDSKALSESKDPGGWLIREHLKLPLYRMFSPGDPGVVASLVLNGLAGYWAVSRGFVADPFDCLLTPISEHPASSSKEQRLQMMGAIRRLLPAADVNEEALTLVGFDFAKRLTSTFSMQEILAMEKVKVGEHLWSFLQSQP